MIEVITLLLLLFGYKYIILYLYYMMFNNYYLYKGGYVIGSVYLSFCLLVIQLIFLIDFLETFWVPAGNYNHNQILTV